VTLTSFHASKAAIYIQNALVGFIVDPAETDHQCGYLSALLDVFRHGLDRGAGDARIAVLDQQLQVRVPDAVIPSGPDLDPGLLDDLLTQAWTFAGRDARRAVAYLRAAIRAIEIRPGNFENDNIPPEAV
jgi:hypothetical protein